MITDHWTIIQLTGQLSSLIIFIVAFLHSIKILRHWNINESGAEQIALERKTYLVSVIIHYVLFFQLLLLILFIEIVNGHLPSLIKGAMCAQGTLGVNAYGFPLLYTKVLSLIFYGIFLFVNYLDQSEPYYPLTPTKYKMMPLLLLFILLDFILTFQYFYSIKADVIATCCSISFSSSFVNRQPRSITGIMQSHVLSLFYALSGLFLLGLILVHKRLIGLLLSAAAYVVLSVIVLKEHFIRYIYARPTHNCLFDVFWGEYYYIGFILYGLLLFVIMDVIFMNILFIFTDRLSRDYSRLLLKMRYAAIISVLTYLIIVHLYWLRWIILS